MRLELTKDNATVVMNSVWPKVKEALASGKHLTLEIKAANKSRDQEKLYHELIGQVAKQAKHMGAKWDAEDWKRLLVDQFARDCLMYGAPILQNLDGTGIVQLGVQTRKFTKEQASEFVEWLYAWGAEHGVVYEVNE